MEIRDRGGVRSDRPADGSSRGLRRRDLLRLAVGGGTGLALGSIVDLSAVKASAQTLTLANVTEFTTSCNFCSCGCGMVGSVRDGKLIKLEGRFDHVVNEGSLCVKGMAMFPTHASPLRNQTPRYRAPGSDHWVDITWEDAREPDRAEDPQGSRRALDRHREEWRQGCPGEPDRRLRVHGRRAEHERGVLPVPEGGTPSRHGLRRTPGPSLTQPHGPRSGGRVRTRRDDQSLGRPSTLRRRSWWRAATWPRTT